MGDVVSLVEKAAETIEADEAEKWPPGWPRVSSRSTTWRTSSPAPQDGRYGRSPGMLPGIGKLQRTTRMDDSTFAPGSDHFVHDRASGGAIRRLRTRPASAGRGRIRNAGPRHQPSPQAAHGDGEDMKKVGKMGGAGIGRHVRWRHADPRAAVRSRRRTSARRFARWTSVCRAWAPLNARPSARVPERISRASAKVTPG